MLLLVCALAYGGQVIGQVDLLAKHECLNGAMVQLRAELHHQGLGSLSAQLHVERVARRR